MTDEAADDDNDDTDGGYRSAPPSLPGAARSLTIIIRVNSKNRNYYMLAFKTSAKVIPSRILCISVYGAWTEAATSACVTSLDRARFDQLVDMILITQFSIFARKCTFYQLARAGHIIILNMR